MVLGIVTALNADVLAIAIVKARFAVFSWFGAHLWVGYGAPILAFSVAGALITDIADD